MRDIRFFFQKLAMAWNLICDQLQLKILLLFFFSVLSFSGKIYKIILDFESGLGK